MEEEVIIELLRALVRMVADLNVADNYLDCCDRFGSEGHDPDCAWYRAYSYLEEQKSPAQSGQSSKEE